MSQQGFAIAPEEMERLRREALALHRALFAAEASPALIGHYVQAHQFVRLAGSGAQLATVRQVIDHGLDAEAVELALRHRQPRHPLRQKLQILTYLVESDCRYYRLFVNDRPSFGRALLLLAAHLLRSAGKMVKGRILVWRHALA